MESISDGKALAGNMGRGWLHVARAHWPIGMGVMIVLATTHAALWVSLAHRATMPREVRSDGLRIEASSQSQAASRLPAPMAVSDPGATAALEDFSVAMLVSMLCEAAAGGRTPVVEALVPRIQATGDRGRRLARAALAGERRPPVRAALERVLE